MATNVSNIAEIGKSARLLTSLVQAEGSVGHALVADGDQFAGRNATRDLADVVHYLCTLHGRYPGVIDHAATRTAHVGAREWLIRAVDGFVVERNFLTKLVVAAGPMPSTPGQAESESAVTGQRHALEMLAQSDREGCALGAALTLVLDWAAIRSIMNRAAMRWSMTVPPCTLPNEAETLAVAEAVAVTPAVERAFGFGAQQILAQHRGLWDLLEARQIARGDMY
jgi:hypothetical protein